MKRKKWSIIILLGVLLTCIPVFIINGTNQSLWEQAISSDPYTKNPLAWLQTDSNDIAVPADENTVLLGDGRTIGTAGCSYFSHCMMLIRAGKWDTQTDGTISDFVKLCKSKGMSQSSSDWLFDHTSISDIESSVKIVDAEYLNMSQKYYTVSELADRAKKAFERGDYMVTYMMVDNEGAHAVFIDSVTEDGKIVLQDCSSFDKYIDGPESMFHDIMASEGGYEAPIVFGIFEYSIEGADSRDTRPLWDRFSGGLDSDEGVFLPESERHHDSEDEKKKKEDEKNRMRTEYEAIDWKPTQLLMNQRNFNIEDMASKTTAKERRRMEDIKTNIEEDEPDLKEVISECFVGAGLLLSLEGIFLIVADLIDRYLVLGKTSLVKIFTFGRYRIREGKEDTEGVSRWTYYIYAMTVIGIGVLLASGFLQVWVLKLYDLIQTFFFG